MASVSIYPRSICFLLKCYYWHFELSYDLYNMRIALSFRTEKTTTTRGQSWKTATIFTTFIDCKYVWKIKCCFIFLALNYNFRHLLKKNAGKTFRTKWAINGCGFHNCSKTEFCERRKSGFFLERYDTRENDRSNEYLDTFFRVFPHLRSLTFQTWESSNAIVYVAAPYFFWLLLNCSKCPD